jgi:hypothetical protein
VCKQLVSGWKMRINKSVAGYDETSVSKAEMKGENREKCLNGAITPDGDKPFS